MNKGINKDEMLKLIEKIEMYRLEEVKLQSNIKSVLENMKVYLKDSNYKTIASRLEMLYLDFDTSISNKEKYVQLILKIISSYEDFENKIVDKLQ